MEPLVILLHDRREGIAGRLDLAGHAIAAMGLVAAAAGSLPARTPVDAVLAALELVAAAVLAMAIRRELSGGGSGEARVSWLNLAAAAVLLVQWGMERHAGGKLFSPELLSAMAAAAAAFLHPLARRRRAWRRRLVLDDRGIELRLSRFRGYRAEWSALCAVEATPETLRFVSRDGTERRIGLGMIVNRAEVVDAVAAVAGRAGLAASPPRPPTG